LNGSTPKDSGPNDLGAVDSFMQINSNTVAVVTGAASGIGRALAQHLAAKGAALALADVNEAGLEETRASLSGVKTSLHIVNVADASRVATFAQEVLEQHGRANLLFNNAGVALGGRFSEVTLEDMQWLININFWGVVHGCQAFMPILQKEPFAHIVNTSSVFGIFAPPGQTAYAAAKFAVRGFSESLRHELEGSSVKLSVVHPGGIKTNIARNARFGANAKVERLEQGLKNLEKSFITTPEAAAERIVRGVERNEPRILVGRDAVQVDWIQRLFPSTYWSVLKKVLR
jgi:NADP-dependent 3-hydroxy acid dehydrogenase YdfG